MAQETDLSSSNPSRQILEEAPQRALKFLGAVGRFFAIRAKLAARGYDDTEHHTAWDLLHRVTHFEPQSTSSFSQDQVVRVAVVSLDNWDEPGFRITAAALKHRHPEQHAFVFENLEPAQGEAAVLSVSRFLGRLDELESSPDRVATRAADLAALETLAKRGIHAQERARLRGLVDTAQSVLMPPGESPERQQNLAALHGWLEEWSETAKAVITRRDYLIALGLLKRRKKKVEPADRPARAGTSAATKPEEAPANRAPVAVVNGAPAAVANGAAAASASN